MNAGRLAEIRARYDAVIAERTVFWTAAACGRRCSMMTERGAAAGPCMLSPGHAGDCTPYPPSEGLPETVALSLWEVGLILDDLERFRMALALIESGPPDYPPDNPMLNKDNGWSMGVAMGALASADEADPLA
jgi:hypothetical protein